jgi:hypothetical protein
MLEEISASRSCREPVSLTVTENELGNTSNVHSDATKEVVVAAQSRQTCRSNSTLEAAENENRGGVWD